MVKVSFGLIKTNNMKNIEYILNDCLNKAMCQKGRIQHPNSNNIADFVSKYLQKEKLTLTDVVGQSEQYCECKHPVTIQYSCGCFKCGKIQKHLE